MSRSSDRPAHTPRGARSDDHHSRPGALPPAPGRRLHFWRLWRSPAVPAVLGAAFCALAEQVVTHGPLLSVDRAVRGDVQAVATAHSLAWVGDIAEYWTDLGSVAVAGPLLAVAAGVACVRARRVDRGGRWWRSAVTALLGALLLLGTVIPLKDVIGRPGPGGVAATDGGYFPSGHTATATVCLALAVWLVARGRRSVRVLTGVALLGVGAGLIWRDYHWLTDVLGAWCLSGVLLWLIVRLRA